MANSVSRQLIKAEVLRRGWKWQTFGHDAFLAKITNDSNQVEYLRGTQPMQTSANGFLIAKYKDISMAFLQSIGYAVPPYTIPADQKAALQFMDLHGRVVVKPIDGSQSKGVSVNISSPEQLIKAMDSAKRCSPSNRIILQRHLDGNLYRLMVVNDTFIGAVQRRAAQVTGDGRQTVRRLITELNRDPRRGTDSTTIMKRIDLMAALEYLGKDSMETVLPPGQTQKVTAIDSVSAGGEAINVTDMVHPTWRQATISIARQAKMFVCGFDVICPDIAKPVTNPVPILEFNTMPGLKLLHHPTGGGEPINAAAMLLDEIFV